MGVHPFQIADLNWNFFQNSPASSSMGSFASEFGIFPDNVNASCSRYLKLQAVWPSVNIGAISSSPLNDSYGQATGGANNANDSHPLRPNGGYFVRGLYFTNTATPNSDSSGAFRVGYVGSFVGGLLDADYAHDPNGSTVDYEPIYSHGTVGGWPATPMVASQAKQWRDPNNAPSDGTDLIVNSGSALTRTIYMPASYMLLHIDSVGSNQLVSGDVKFHFENRPTLHMAGYADNLGQSTPGASNWTGTGTGLGASISYSSDPLFPANGGLTQSATNNFHELYQVTGVRKLNSRGLSFHIAKVFDNGAYAFAYPYEEDGITLGAGITLVSSQIQAPYTYVNDQQEYVWAGGRDVGASITSIISSGTVVTFTANNTFSTNQIVLVQGLTSGNNTWLNGMLVTVASANSTSFTSTISHSSYSATADYGAAVYKPDFRVRQTATFTINEEYYGTVMDTKCAIWSNKSSMIPLLFFDLADVWTASVAKRVAGVAVVPLYSNQTITWQVFFLSEDGFLAIYDFTQTNGVLSLGVSAPVVAAAGEAYGSLRVRSTSSAITATSVAGNTLLTVTCSNTFEVGEIVNITGTAESAINNTTVTITALIGGGPTFTGFTATIPSTTSYTNASDTGTAFGQSLWALYGTMYPDPRITQTGLTNDANINLYRYLIGTSTWGSKIASPTAGRHNGRSLGEMIVARDSKVYILCEDVTTSAGFTVSNSFGAVTNVNWQVMAYDPSAAAWNSTKINGSTLLQYGTNFGTPSGDIFSQSRDFWFQNINTSLHDIGVGSVLIQPNWTAGNFQILNVSGSTASLSNSDLSVVSSSTLFPGDSFIPSAVNPAITAVTVVHARDFATNAERSTFWLHDLLRSNNSVFPLYLAPPSFNWVSPSALTQIPRNAYSSFPPTITTFQKDYWSYNNITTMAGNTFEHYAWSYPVMLEDNYIHFVEPSSGSDGIPQSAIYGRAAGQGMGFLPTYWKWTGTAWVMADNWTDASTNSYTVPNANVNVPLPYGLQCQFGPLGTTSYSQFEYETWNMAYGNTKFARKMRQSYATFGGQTFTNQDTRTVATQNALQMHLIDTDIGTATNTAPTSATPNTATLTPTNLGWVTATTWNKLDGVNAPFDATPFVTVWNVNSNALNTSAFAYPPAANVTGTTPGPYTWTVGANTYAATANGESGVQFAWYAVAGNPQLFWQSNTSNAGTLTIDMGLSNPQTVLTYSFRPLYTSVDTLDLSTPKTWQLQASANGTFTDNGGGPFIIDTRTNVTSFNRGAVFACNGSTGSYRYYRVSITAVQNGVNNPSLSMLRLNTAALQTTVNFSEIVFYAYGSQVGPNYVYPFIRNWQMARGIMLEVSTDGGSSYTTVFQPGVTSPSWRALNGYVFTFPRQTGVTNVRVTVNHGYNYNTLPDSSNQAAITGFGPFYFIDYGDGGGSYGSDTSQATINAARLGNNLAPVATPAKASFDPQCLGIAVDVPNISLDGGNPSAINAANVLVDTAVHGFWDFNFMPDATHSPTSQPEFKMHPFFGFIFFQGAGGSGGVSTNTNTTAVINYQWGRRV